MFKSLLPIMADDDFVDRDESRTLISALQGRSPQCISLIGLPGSGKSSLLLRAQRHLTPGSTALVDLGPIDKVTDETFCSSIATSVGSLSTDLGAALDMWAARERRILLIDNFDRVAEGVSGNCLARLRAFISGRHLGRLLLAVASTRPLYQLCEAVRGSAFFNIFLAKPVTGLPESGITSQAKFVEDGGDSIKCLMSLTGGFPGLVTRLALAGWTSWKNPVPFEALDGVAAMYRSLDASERVLLRELAKGEPNDVIALSPPDKVSYLAMVGLIERQGEMPIGLVKTYAKTAVSLPEADELPPYVTAMILLRRTELALRGIIRKAIDANRIPHTCFSVALKDSDAYLKLLSRKEKLRFSVVRDDCEAAYLPDLARVISEYYGAFTDYLTLKRKAFAEHVEIIKPFRNDQFHFHDMPDVEFKRAEVALNDLLTGICE
jgi:hypothetical protein